MASKASASIPAYGERRDDTLVRPERWDEPVPNRLLQRIADALHVPLSTLREPSNRAHDPDDNGATYIGLADECAALLHAYTCIHNLSDRHRLLSLVQATAERT